MISYTLSVIGIIAATLIPVYFALYLITNLRLIHTSYLAAVGLGLVFWFFFDTLNDAAQLDVNESFTGGAAHAGLIVAFIAGVMVLVIFDHFAVPISKAAENVAKPSNGTPLLEDLFLIPAGIAMVMGIHGFGEGWDFALVASQAPTQSLTEAFGGFSAIASYPLHKFLEASIIAIVYTAFVGRSSIPKSKYHLPVLGLLLGLPSAIGAAIGYYVVFDTTYFYAFGVTAVLYAVLRLVEPVSLRFKIGDTAPSFIGPKVFLAALIGFLLLYVVALLH